MLTSLHNFDPITFLDINKENLEKEEVVRLGSLLNSQIGEYLLLRFSDFLSDEQIEQVTKAKQGKEIYIILKKSFPDIDKKIMQELENFKKDYQNMKKEGN